MALGAHPEIAFGDCVLADFQRCKYYPSYLADDYVWIVAANNVLSQRKANGHTAGNSDNNNHDNNNNNNNNKTNSPCMCSCDENCDGERHSASTNGPTNMG